MAMRACCCTASGPHIRAVATLLSALLNQFAKNFAGTPVVDFIQTISRRSPSRNYVTGENQVRNLFLSFTTMFAICAAPLLIIQTSSAQSAPEPAIVISMAPLGEQLDDMKHLVNLSGFGNLNFMIQSQVKYYTGGIDRKKASGAYLYFEGDDPKPKWLGMVAVEDGEKILDQIANFADIDEGDDYITVTVDSNDEFLIKETDGYFLISDDKAMFEMAPENPSEKLLAVSDDFNVAVRVFGQRVPQELRDKGIELVTDGFNKQMEELEQVEGLDQMDQSLFEAQLEQVKSLVNETDELTMGYKIDKQKKLLTSTFSMTTLEGSEFAKRLEGMNPPGDSDFTGFLNDNAAVDFNLRYQLHEDDVKLYVSLMDNMREQMIEEIDADGELTDEELATVETASSNIAESFKATLEGKLIDTGGVLVMDENSFNFASGSSIVDTEKFEEAVKSLVDLAETKADGKLQAQLNSGAYDDITLHTISVSIPEDEEEVRDIFGSQIQIIVGVSPDKVYFGVGKDPLTTLTDAIERSKTPKPSEYGQLMYNLRVAPILRFASKASGEESLADMASALENDKTGRITLWSKAIPNGIETNIEAQEGILALIKLGWDAYAEGAFQGDDDMDEF